MTESASHTIQTMPNQIPFSFDVPSVSELTQKIKQILEQNFRDVLVEGEISNLSQSRNGHFYFTVKDDNAQLPCVIWRNSAERMNLDIHDGQQVVLGGDIQLYAPHGRYQMIVTLVQQAGVGRLQQKFEELKKKLEAEGLFDQSHKKKIPGYPKKIGVITSSTGAAFHDIRSTMEQRWPVATLYLHHASVQGLNAAGEIANAIVFFAQQKNPVDLLIIGRGGGSLEDLWPFNEEIVARSIYDCPIPIISAVGHEVDFSISDFVADARAATPTHAAVMAVPDINEVNMKIEDLSRRLQLNTKGALQYYKDKVTNLTKSYALLAVQQKMKNARDKISSFEELLKNRTSSSIRNQKDLLVTLGHRLDKMNPNEPLNKGFARVWQGDKWIRSSNTLQPKEGFEIEWKDGKTTIN
jgi:exodeoxyribonuclease VII large subunit